MWQVFKEYLHILVFCLLALLLILFIFGVFDSSSNLVKPCEGMSGDIYQECVDYYFESGWTWDEIKNGILVTNK